MATASGITPLLTFARRLRGYLHGIIASAKYRLNTSVLEGMNNRIKVIKRAAYGYRDSAYFFLKIKAVSSIDRCNTLCPATAFGGGAYGANGEAGTLGRAEG
jgi:hypothetical protein